MSDVDPQTDWVIRINGEPSDTLSIAADQYYTVPDTQQRSLSIYRVELFDPDGVCVLRFYLKQAFAVPRGEWGFLWMQCCEGEWDLGYMQAESPKYLEEVRGSYVWDDDLQRFRTALL
jgi:hypothetical protein